MARLGAQIVDFAALPALASMEGGKHAVECCIARRGGSLCRAADGKGVGKQEAWEMHRKLMKRQYFGEDPPYFSEMM